MKIVKSYDINAISIIYFRINKLKVKTGFLVQKWTAFNFFDYTYSLHKINIKL
jgi:hypothetical protein